MISGCAHEASPPSKAEQQKEGEEDKVVTAPPPTPTEAPPIQTPTGVAVAPSGAPAKPLPPKIKIKIRLGGAASYRPEKAIVFWGKKKLGETPLDFERPRDSGPIDLVIRADGYFPLHTRAYTFRNDVLWVKLTKLEDQQTLFGAKRNVNEPPPGSVPDGGTPLPAPQ